MFFSLDNQSRPVMKLSELQPRTSASLCDEINAFHMQPTFENIVTKVGIVHNEQLSFLLECFHLYFKFNNFI